MKKQSVRLPGGSAVKNLPTKQEIWVQSPGQEDILKREIATYSNILAREMSWTEEPSQLQSMESQELATS